MIKEQDADGNGYWKYDDGQFVLTLKQKPTVGSQHKTIAWLGKDGTYTCRHLVWDEKRKCWWPSRFPLIKTATFGIRIVRIEAVDGKGRKWEGFVHPRTLTHRNEQRHSTGFEKQLQLLTGDICETEEEAVEIWERLKK